MLSQLSLSHFRNHAERSFKLAPQTVVLGPNGAGKTNILEAVAMLSVTTSWKTERDSEVIEWGQPFTRIVGDDRELVIQRHPYYKRIRIDGVSKRVGEVLGTMPTTLFQPEDSTLVYGSPAYRRMSLDRLLSQTDRDYARALVHLQKVVRQRNRLLKMIQEGEATLAELDYWDQELATHGELVKQRRQEALPILEATMTEVFRELVPENGAVRMEYHQSPRVMDEASFFHHLQANRHKEVAAGNTLYGPHREDICFMWGEHLATESLSRGQARALVIAFKVAELRYIEQHTEVSPILLLDDVFSEFDEQRRERIIDLMAKYQTVMTVTELGPLKGRLPKEAEIIEL